MNSKQPPPNLAQMLDRAVAAHKDGRLDHADELYRQILKVSPDQFDARHWLGVLRAQQGRAREALELIDAALKGRPGDADALFNRGNVLAGLARYDEALASFDRALAARPDYPQALYNRGNALLSLDRNEEALAAYDQLLAANVELPVVHNSRGAVLAKFGRMVEALESYNRALAVQPDYLDAMVGQGNAFAGLGRHAEALGSYNRALAADPNDAELLAQRGHTLVELGRPAEALASYDKSLQLSPRQVDLLRRRGNCLRELARLPEAIESYERALALDPGNARLKLAKCIAQLPELYDNEDEIGARRDAYAQELRALDAELKDRPGELADVVGAVQPFFLAYQGRNDRELQSVYGKLVCREMAARFRAPPPVVQPPSPSEPVRVGFVSGYFRRHTVWKVVLSGWLGQMDRKRFELIGYHTGKERDAATAAAAVACARFVEAPKSVAEWREAILADAPHVLIYPEIGMDPIAGALAALRLAPVQCMAWGHPTTSGYPTIDYYLGSDLMEPEGAEAHYTEKLVRLPNLSIYYEPPEAKPVAISRAQLGLREGATLYWCAQSLFKYLPQYDQLFPRIAREVPGSQFVFFAHLRSPARTEQFRKRLDRAFASLGLAAEEHCMILPRLSLDEFIAASGLCDVMLDSFGWSGGNTTLETLTHGVPIVTLEGEFMRGRQTSTVLQMMDVTETIAATLDDYVAIAVRLGQDAEQRRAIKAKMIANKDRIYRDRAAVAALQDFLDRVVRSPG
jgi:predicted O-linked N-acetylglucosamine transferase (SPINDLY family)